MSFAGHELLNDEPRKIKNGISKSRITRRVTVDLGFASRYAQTHGTVSTSKLDNNGEPKIRQHGPNAVLRVEKSGARDPYAEVFCEPRCRVFVLSREVNVDWGNR
jgi:hypothetical protein